MHNEKRINLSDGMILSFRVINTRDDYWLDMRKMYSSKKTGYTRSGVCFPLDIDIINCLFEVLNIYVNSKLEKLNEIISMDLNSVLSIQKIYTKKNKKSWIKISRNKEGNDLTALYLPDNENDIMAVYDELFSIENIA